MSQPDTKRPLPPRARLRYEEIPPPPEARRVLIFAKAKRHTRVTAHFIRGFEENGHQVLWLHSTKIQSYLGRWLGRAYLRWRMKRFRPDMILIYAKDAPLEILDEVPDSTPIAVFYEDALHEPHPEVLAMARKATMLFTTARGQVPLFRDLGIPEVRYLRTGCDRTDHFPDEPDPAFEGEVAFIGTGSMEDRIELMRRIDERYDLRLYGKRWSEALGRAADERDVYPETYRTICASSGIVVGIDPRDDVDLYFSNRTWLTLGCGGFLLTRYVPNLEEFFANHEHLVWYRSFEECLELIERYLDEPGERRRIARNGAEYVRTYHTFRHATAELMAELFGETWPE